MIGQYFIFFMWIVNLARIKKDSEKLRNKKDIYYSIFLFLIFFIIPLSEEKIGIIDIVWEIYLIMVSRAEKN